MADYREGDCVSCRELMRQFTAYREQVIIEKEAMRRQIEKSKQQLQRFMTKLDKRVESRINEERLVNNHNLEKLEEFHRQEQTNSQSLSAEKDRLIDELRSLLRSSQNQRKELIQSNTRVLVEMAKQIQRESVGEKQGKDKSYWQLMKMYQFLIEQNNQLKKEIYLIRRNNVSKQEKSGFQSEHKPKEVTMQSSVKPDNLNMSKSFTSKDGEKPQKKVPKSKHK